MADDTHEYLLSLHPHSVRLGLHRMDRALADLGNPERNLHMLLVAGTNGKGSACAMAAAALHQGGYRVGLYTSPHLHSFNERIQLNGQPLSDAVLTDLVQSLRAACPWHDHSAQGGPLTFFEVATLLALLYFAKEEVDVAVLETGLGGEFDATSALHPCAMAMTRIGMDHSEYFGHTLEAIARAEASIFKPRVPVVVAADQSPEAMLVLQTEAERIGAPLTIASSAYRGELSLRGAHQRQNAALAKAALELLARSGERLGAEVIARGFANTQWPARLEEMGGVLLDLAHNADAARSLVHAFDKLYPDRPVELVFGVAEIRMLLLEEQPAGM